MTEEELGEIGLPPPFWAFAWAGGQALARYLLDHPAEAKGKRVFDVGTGSGLVAIAAMKAGAEAANGCDIDGFCAAAVELNARANGVEVGFGQRDPFDRAAAGRRGHLRRRHLLRAAAGRPRHGLADARRRRSGARVLLGDPGRSYFPKSGLVKLAEYSVATTRELEDAEVKKTAVWTFPTPSDGARR